MKNIEQNNHRPVHSQTENTRKPGQPQSFQVWLRSAPAITGDQSVSVTVTLTLDDWFSVCQAAAINKKSIDEIVSYIVRERVNLTEWFNKEYAMETAEDGGVMLAETRGNGGNSDWVKLPSGLRERAERDCEKFKVDVPFEFLVRDALETQIRCLEDERNRENIRDAWRDA